MESIFFIAGALFGAGLCFLSGRHRERPPEKKEELPPKLKKQWENFARYDGTDKGQVKIDE